MIFDSMAAIRSFENPISMRRNPAASGSRPLRITKSSMNHLSLRDLLSQAGSVRQRRGSASLRDDFCNKIGTKRSIRNVHFRAACGGKADLERAMVSELDL